MTKILSNILNAITAFFAIAVLTLSAISASYERPPEYTDPVAKEWVSEHYKQTLPFDSTKKPDFNLGFERVQAE